MNQHDRHGSATDHPGEVLRSRGGYPITEKMRWRTAPWLFRALDDEFHFDLDACAEDGCALAPRWLTHEEDALVVDWRLTYRQRFGDDVEPTLVELETGERSSVRAAFQNPPPTRDERMRRYLEAIAEERRVRPANQRRHATYLRS